MLADRCEGDEQLQELDYQIGMTEDPEQTALDELRRHQREMGIVFEDPDAPVAGKPDDGLEPWMTQDEEFR